MVLRQTRGLNDRRVAQHLGVSISTIRLLDAGTNHDRLPLGMVKRLGDLLGADIRALLLEEETDDGRDHEARRRKDGTPDHVRLHAALAELDRPVEATPLAAGLGWRLSRVRRAAADLRQALEGTGQVLSHISGVGYRLRPRVGILSDAEVRRLHRSRVAGPGLRHTDIALLVKVMRGDIGKDWSKHTGESERIAMGRLRRLGLVERVDHGYELTEDARTSLLVDEFKPELSGVAA